MHRIICPTMSLARALADIINEEGGTATVTWQGGPIVQAEAPSDVVSGACLALSFGRVKVTPRGFVATHYMRSL